MNPSHYPSLTDGGNARSSQTDENSSSYSDDSSTDILSSCSCSCSSQYDCFVGAAAKAEFQSNVSALEAENSSQKVLVPPLEFMSPPDNSAGSSIVDTEESEGTFLDSTRSAPARINTEKCVFNNNNDPASLDLLTTRSEALSLSDGCGIDKGLPERDPENDKKGTELKGTWASQSETIVKEKEEETCKNSIDDDDEIDEDSNSPFPVLRVYEDDELIHMSQEIASSDD